MFDWLRAALARTRDTVHDLAASMVPPYMAKALWTSTASIARYLHLAQSAYGLNALVYSCVRLLAQSVPEAPLIAYRQLRDGEREPLGWDHELQRLIHQPNELMTEYEMVEMIETHLDLAGRAFLWKQRANNGRPLALWPLRPDRVGPIYSTSDVDGERVLGGWSYAMPGSGDRIMIAREDVIAFNFPDPAGETGGMVEGLGPTMVLAREIAADNEATSFVGALLANYAQPSMVIKTKIPIADEKTARALKSAFMRQLGGAHRGEPAVLDADTTIEKLSFNLQELEFPGLRANAETRVAAAYGVPPILVGLKAGLDRATYSNMQQARAYFAQTTLRNRWRRYGDQFTNDLAKEFGDDFVLAFDDTRVASLAESRAAEVKPLADAFGQGAITINEYRVRVLGLPELPGGDVLKGTAPITVRSHAAATIKADPEPVPPAFVPAITTRTRATTALEETLTDALQRLGATVAERLQTESKALADVDQIYFDDDNDEIRQAIEQAAGGIMPEAVLDASGSTGIALTFSLDWPDVDEALTAAGERIVGISDTTRARIVAVLKQGLELGEHPFEVAERLRTDFGFSRARARVIARTEMAEAYAAATLGAYREAGVERVRVWDGTDWDEPCRAVHGTTQTLEWYRGNRTAHPQCTRAVAPERGLA